MNPSHSFALLALLLLTLLNGFFTLAEVALNTVRNARLQDLIEEGGADGAAAGSAQRLMRQPTRVVATVQVGITLASFTVSAIAAATLAPDWASALPLRVKALRPGPSPRPRHDGRADRPGCPRHHRRRRDRAPVNRPPPARSGRPADRPPTCVSSWSCWPPLAGIALGLSNLLVRPFGLTATFAAPMITEEELRALLEASAQSGAIEEDEKEIIRNVISFGDHRRPPGDDAAY